MRDFMRNSFTSEDDTKVEGNLFIANDKKRPLLMKIFWIYGENRTPLPKQSLNFIQLLNFSTFALQSAFC